MNMVEKDDLNFLEKAISNKSYNLLKQIRLNEYDQNLKKWDFLWNIFITL